MANKVEVKITASTDALSEGMKESKKIVEDGAKKIEQAGDGVKLKVDTSDLTSSVKKATSDIQKNLKDSTQSISKSFTEQFKAGLNSSELGSSIDGVTSKLGGLRGGAILAAGALTGLVIGGVIGATVGLANLALETAKNNVELAKFAALANSSIQDFQGLAGAAQVLGMSQEKMADMMKDFNEKIGEFASVGSGGAKDFFEQIAVKTEHGAEGAKKLAEEMSKMDGATALQTYVDKLEEAGVNQQQMSFYLESMGSDLTTLAPVLANGGKLWKDYQAALEDAGIITGDEAIKRSIELKAQTESLQLQYNGLKNQLAQAVMPVMSSLISHFMNGAEKGAGFANIIQVVGSVARGVAISITVLATGIQNLVRLISGAISSMQTIGTTAINFANADGLMAKGLVLLGGIRSFGGEVKSTMTDIVSTSKAGMTTIGDIWSGNSIGFDKLTQANINIQQAQLHAKGGKSGITSGIGQNKALNPDDKKHNGKTPKQGKSDVEREAEREAKAIADIRYKYATKEQKIALDLAKALDEIEKSKATNTEKISFRAQAEKDASEKIKQLRADEFVETKQKLESEIEAQEKQAQRSFEISKAQIQAEFDAGKISNVEKVKLEKDLYDQLLNERRRYLEQKLALEDRQTAISGKDGRQGQIKNQIADVDADLTISDTQFKGLISDAQMKDFEKKFSGLTSRMSNLWDQGMQAMMNGTLSWKNALSTIYSELAAEFIQKMITAPLKEYVKSIAPRLAAKLGLIKAETSLEVAGQASQTGAVVAGETAKTAATSTGVFARLGLKLMEVIKSIMMSAWEAMAAAWAALSAIPIVGPALGVAAGIAAFAGVSAIVGKVASARGGYDIPSGVNPMTQLHEEEMVLPKQHANTIRALGKSVMGDGSMMQQPAYAGDAGVMPQVNIQAWDSKDLKRFMKKHGRELAGGLKGYSRNFGK